jgi:hypothetical protein
LKTKHQKQTTLKSNENHDPHPPRFASRHAAHLCSCSGNHPAAAGAAGAAAVNHYQDEQKKEDYAHAKKNQMERKADR